MHAHPSSSAHNPLAPSSGTRSSHAPEEGQKTKLATLVSTSLLAFSLFLIAVVGISLYGLQRFQGSLSGLASVTLPKVVNASTSTTQINRLVLLGDRLVTVGSEAERRLIQREIETQLKLLAEMYADSPERTKAIPQIEMLSKHLAGLHDLVQQRLLLEKRMQTFGGQLEKINMSSALLLAQAYTLPAKMQFQLQEGYLGLLRVLEMAWDVMSPGKGMKLLTAEKRLIADIAAIQNGIGTKDNPLFAALMENIAQLELVLFGPEGLLATATERARIKSESVSAGNVARSMIKDLTLAQLTLFNELLNDAGAVAAETADDLFFFNKFFGFMGVVSVLIALAVIVYFRRTFLVRLERLNIAVLDRVNGVPSIIDTAGADEIAGIARSVNYFATELGISKDQAEASSRAKSEFLANMSHEIRTPMNAIIGFTRMMKETELNPKQQDYLGKIDSSATFLLSMVNDILDFSTIEAGQLHVEQVPFDLRKTISQVVTLTQAKAEHKGLKLHLHMANDIPASLKGVPLRLFQVMNNLCDNAVKFTSKGCIEIDVRVQEKTENDFLLTFKVTDQGIGLTEEQRSKLFQPFTQADASSTRAFGGTGLGLAISRSLCELMGGVLQVESEYGKGSVFFFTLPFGRVEETLGGEISGKPVEPAMCSLAGKWVLLVEDNEINQEIALGLFEGTGVFMDIASTGQEAVEKIQQKKYDVVLMDIQMPGMDGITATKLIRSLSEEYYRQVPILAMTAHTMAEDKIKSQAAGMNDHLSKPLDPALVIPAVLRWIDKSETAQ